MERVKRNERMSVMARILSGEPNTIVTLNRFCEMFGASKSTVSEDIELMSAVFARFAQGEVKTVAGAAGGVRYRHLPTREQAEAWLVRLCRRLSESERILPGGFLYTSDVTSDPKTIEPMGELLAAQYYDAQPDFVLTMETKGIPVATMTARALGVPLVIARRDSKAYEGSAVKINYMAGNDRIETMTLARRAVTAGQRALIIDDFMKGGGTVRGMVDLMAEFMVEVVGVGVVIATEYPALKQVDGVKSLMILRDIDRKANTVRVEPSDWILPSGNA